jgi:CRP-like cAMP-binding protein
MAEIPIPERLRVLKQNEGWFGQAPAEFQDALLERCVWRTYSPGQAIYRTTDTHSDLYGIVAGTVEVFSRFGIGDNPLLHLLHEGLWVGHGALGIVNVSRTTLLQILRRFEGAGLIEQGYRSLRVPKPAELEAVARGTLPLRDAGGGQTQAL